MNAARASDSCSFSHELQASLRYDRFSLVFAKCSRCLNDANFFPRTPFYYYLQ